MEWMPLSYLLFQWWPSAIKISCTYPNYRGCNADLQIFFSRWKKPIWIVFLWKLKFAMQKGSSLHLSWCYIRTKWIHDGIIDMVIEIYFIFFKKKLAVECFFNFMNCVWVWTAQFGLTVYKNNLSQVQLLVLSCVCIHCDKEEIHVGNYPHLHCIMTLTIKCNSCSLCVCVCVCVCDVFAQTDWGWVLLVLRVWGQLTVF